MAIRKRVFNITQALKNPRTGEPLLDVGAVIEKLNTYKSFSRWAWIIHDKDVYSQEEVDAHLQRLKEEYRKNHPDHSEEGETAFIEMTRYVFLGEHKNDHLHLVIQATQALDVDWVAKVLGIPKQYIDFPKGTGAFLDCVEYLTHENEKEQSKGKHLYSDEEVHANFDFRRELDKREDRRQVYGRDLDPKRAMLFDIRYRGKTLKEAQDEDPAMFMDIEDRAKKCRLEYIAQLSPPVTRINYFVEGQGGQGKGIICRAIARSLFPDIKDERDVYFTVGATGVPFDGYDGQPVIIWNDHRAIDLLEKLGGRGNVFNVFDTHPGNIGFQNVKYGKVNLVNAVNIVNSIQPYKEFLDGLAGEYKTSKGELLKAEDKSQSYRRFPFIIPLHEDDFDMLLNRGFMDNTRAYLEYYEYKHIRGNMEKIAIACNGRSKELQYRLEAQTVKPIAEKHKEVMKKFEDQNPDLSDDDIAAQFEAYGSFGETPTVIDVEAVEVKPEVEQMAMDDEDGLPF